MIGETAHDVPTHALPAKAIYLANRKPTLTREQFGERWKHHMRMGTQVRDHRLLSAVVAARYCLRTEQAVLARATDELDGIALLSLASLASVPSFDAVLTQNDVAYADELRTFERPVEEVTLYTASDLIVSGDETEVVVFELARRRSDVTVEDYLAAAGAAREAIVPSLGPDLGVRRWVRNTLIAPARRGAAFDVVTELWFESVEAVAEAAADIEHVLDTTSPMNDRHTSVTLVAEVIASVGDQRP